MLALALFYFLHSHAQQAAERSFDNLLAASALSIADSVQYAVNGITLELPYSSHAILASRTSSRIFYRVTDPRGELITGYPDLAADVVPAVSSNAQFTNGTYLGVPVRLCILGRFVSGGKPSGWVTIVVAQSNEDQVRLAEELLRYSLWPAIGTMLLAMALVWLAVRSALRPLDVIEQAIAASDPSNLKTLDVPAPVEISNLVMTLNTMIGRLAKLLSRMHLFIAESAHQIRTPLANLRAQVEVAMDKTDMQDVHRHLEVIHRNAILVSRLANQLLADTMIAHRGAMTSLAPIDLLEAAELATEEFTERTGSRVNLRIETLDATLNIMGDAPMITEAVINLLDNAAKYGGAEQPITVRLHRRDEEAILSVEDGGPGIPHDELAHVTDRFVRGQHQDDIPGSGLGLAIVADVMKHHNGSVSFHNRDGSGLTVRLVFPLATEGDPHE